MPFAFRMVTPRRMLPQGFVPTPGPRMWASGRLTVPRAAHRLSLRLSPARESAAANEAVAARPASIYPRRLFVERKPRWTVVRNTGGRHATTIAERMNTPTKMKMPPRNAVIYRMAVKPSHVRASFPHHRAVSHAMTPPYRCDKTAIGQLAAQIQRRRRRRERGPAPPPAATTSAPRRSLPGMRCGRGPLKKKILIHEWTQIFHE